MTDPVAAFVIGRVSTLATYARSNTIWTWIASILGLATITSMFRNFGGQPSASILQFADLLGLRLSPLESIESWFAQPARNAALTESLNIFLIIILIWIGLTTYTSARFHDERREDIFSANLQLQPSVAESMFAHAPSEAETAYWSEAGKRALRDMREEARDHWATVGHTSATAWIAVSLLAECNSLPLRLLIAFTGAFLTTVFLGVSLGRTEEQLSNRSLSAVLEVISVAISFFAILIVLPVFIMGKLLGFGLGRASDLTPSAQPSD